MSWYGEYETDRIASEYFNEGFVGGCIDVGAAEGTALSNTLAFEQKGWLCLCIEANPEFREQLTKNRKHSIMCAVGAKEGTEKLKIFEPPHIPGFHLMLTGIKPHERIQGSFNLVDTVDVTVKTLDTCISEFGQFSTIDYVSIDTEGNEIDVLSGFDIERWKPKLMVVENLFSEPPLRDYLASRGYKMDRAINYNEFYVPVNGC